MSEISERDMATELVFVQIERILIPAMRDNDFIGVADIIEVLINEIRRLRNEKLS